MDSCGFLQTVSYLLVGDLFVGEEGKCGLEKRNAADMFPRCNTVCYAFCSPTECGHPGGKYHARLDHSLSVHGGSTKLK